MLLEQHRRQITVPDEDFVYFRLSSESCEVKEVAIFALTVCEGRRPLYSL